MSRSWNRPREKLEERRACGFGWWLWGTLAWLPARPLQPPAATILMISFLQTMLTAISMSAIATNGVVPGM